MTTTDLADDVAAHETSLAVWDIPAPIILGQSVRLKVGVRCAGGCPLIDHEIELLDTAENKVAVTKLGSTPWPGTAGLYWAEVRVLAPLQEGTHLWTARFSRSAVEKAHSPSSLPFSLTTVKPPEHRVTIEVVQQNTNTIIDNSEVRLGAFRALTNADGVAILEVPKGTYELNAWKVGYEFATRNLEVSGDVSIKVELPVEPEPSPYG
jgi:hypothetical protein